MPNLAIIGAGVSGLSAAFQLKQANIEAQVFEKSRGFSGRAASRSRKGCRYDYGANYFKPDSDEVARLVFQSLPTDDLSPVPGDISVFDEDGNISPGDPKQNAQAKWNYRSGISTLGKLIVQSGQLDVTRETRITSLARLDSQWWVNDEKGREHGPFDAVLLTAPGPQTVELLTSVEEFPPVPAIARELSKAEYYCQFAVALHFSEPIKMPGDSYALINTDRGHGLAWISHENRKCGRIPDGESILMAQLSPEWSEAHYDDDPDSIINYAWKFASDLLPDSLPRPDWGDTQRWRFAHPHTAADPAVLQSGQEMGLFFAGDALVGKGRVTRAMETGLQAATAIEAHLAMSKQG